MHLYREPVESVLAQGRQPARVRSCAWYGRLPSRYRARPPPACLLGTFTRFGGKVSRRATRLTCTITTPPARRVACAIASISPSTASSSIVTLPSSSAVVPRMNVTFSGNGLNRKYSSPSSSMTSTKSAGVRGLCRADDSRRYALMRLLSAHSPFSFFAQRMTCSPTATSSPRWLNTSFSAILRPFSSSILITS